MFDVLGAITGSSFKITQALVEELVGSLKSAQQERKSYVAALERAEDDKVFKYILLINTAALEEYIIQTRIQAQQSFKLCQITGAVGFILLIVGVISGFLYEALGKDNFSPSYIAALAGALVQFISGVMFVNFNYTLKQINLFHDKILQAIETAMAFLAADMVIEEAKCDDKLGELATLLMQARRKLE